MRCERPRWEARRRMVTEAEKEDVPLAVETTVQLRLQACRVCRDGVERSYQQLRAFARRHLGLA